MGAKVVSREDVGMAAGWVLVCAPIVVTVAEVATGWVSVCVTVWVLAGTPMLVAGAGVASLVLVCAPTVVS